jgi:hypothetical protein
MKKIWLIFALTVIIASQVTFMSSFHSTFASSYVSGTSAVVVSKMKYAYARATINILTTHNPDVTITFSNGTQLEISEHAYKFEIFLPRTGDFFGTFETSTHLPSTTSDTPLSMALSRNNPIDVDVVPDIPEDFLSWYGNSNYDSFSDKVDIFWFKIEGTANVFVNGNGMAI